jgi:hypothetical protein
MVKVIVSPVVAHAAYPLWLEAIASALMAGGVVSYITDDDVMLDTLPA